eukprot:601839-Alexandrium_andersonii.AAC.1
MCIRDRSRAGAPPWPKAPGTTTTWAAAAAARLHRFGAVGAGTMTAMSRRRAGIPALPTAQRRGLKR